MKTSLFLFFSLFFVVFGLEGSVFSEGRQLGSTWKEGTLNLGSVAVYYMHGKSYPVRGYYHGYGQRSYNRHYYGPYQRRYYRHYDWPYYYNHTHAYPYYWRYSYPGYYRHYNYPYRYRRGVDFHYLRDTQHRKHGGVRIHW